MFQFTYKLFTTLVAVFILFGSLGLNYRDSVAAVFDDSRSIDLSRGTLILFMEQTNSSYRLRNRVDNYRGSGLPQLSCEVKLPNGVLNQRTNCDEDFSYNNSNGTLLIYASLDDQQVVFEYNTNTERFTAAYEGSLQSNNGSSSSTNCTSSNSSCTLDLGTDDDTPSINQSVDLTVRFTSSSTPSYYGQVRFYIYKQNSSNAYVTADSFYDYSIVNDRYSFSSVSDGSYKTLYDHIYFRTNGTYKIRVEDDYGRYDEQTFYVGTSTCGTSCSNSNTATNFLVTTTDTTPDLSQSVSTYVTARDGSNNRAYNYYGTVSFVLEYQDGSNWYTASSSYYSMSPSSIYMSTSDQGYRTTTSHLMFYRSGAYRLKAYASDNTNVYGYVYYDVNSTSTNNNNNTQSKRFDLTTNDDTPGTNTFSTLNVVARDSNGNKWTNYSSRMRFQVYRRMYTSDSWTEITSSNSDNTYYRIYETSYQFYSSNNGEYYRSDFIKFYDGNYDYKVRVVDDYDSSMYGDIYFYLRNTNLGGANGSTTNTTTTNNGSAYRLVGQFSPAVPKEDSAADLMLYVRDSGNYTVSNYNRRVNFTVERRSSPTSSTWSTASSSYCELDVSSYTFSTSNNGYIKLSDLIECKQKGFYRIKMVDDTNSSIYGYVYLTINSSSDFDSSVKGYTSTQLKNIKTQYTNFMSSVNSWEMLNPGFAYDTERKNTWTDLYEKLYEIVYDKSGKDLAKYSEYLDAIQEFNSDYVRLR